MGRNEKTAIMVGASLIERIFSKRIRRLEAENAVLKSLLESTAWSFEVESAVMLQTMETIANRTPSRSKTYKSSVVRLQQAMQKHIASLNKKAIVVRRMLARIIAGDVIVAIAEENINTIGGEQP